MGGPGLIRPPGWHRQSVIAAKAMEDAKIATGVQVFNLPGAGGTVGLQRIVNEKGNGKLAMQMGQTIPNAPAPASCTPGEATM